jgi:hypothetical protein
MGNEHGAGAGRGLKLLLEGSEQKRIGFAGRQSRESYSGLWTALTEGKAGSREKKRLQKAIYYLCVRSTLSLSST